MFLKLSDVKKCLLIPVFILLAWGSLSAQEPVKRSEIIENLKGVPYYIHFVNSGETLTAIAAAYQVSAAEITRLNPEIAGGLKVNQVIKIPVSKQAGQASAEKIPAGKPDLPENNTAVGKRHTIEPKETWFGIARMYQIPVKDLIAANPGIDTLRIGMQIAIPEVADSKPLPSRDGYVLHEVKAGETLYSISKYYSVTIDEIEKSNSGISSGLKAGQFIYVPEKKNTETGTGQTPVLQEPQKYLVHTVKRKETLYSIARQYNLEIGDILKANPEIHGQIRKNDQLMIPVPVVKQQAEPMASPVQEAVKQEPTRGDENQPCNPGVSKDHRYTVALLIPFMLEEADSIVISDPSELRMPSEYHSLDFIEFYEGALLAIDSLSRAGMQVRVLVFDADAGEQVSKTRTILTNPEMAAVDLIIGPFFARSFELVSDFAASHSIPVVNPLSQRAEILDSNPYVFKVQPSAWSQYNATAAYISENYPDANVVIVRRNTDENSSMASLLKTGLDKNSGGSLAVKDVVYNPLSDAGIFSNLAEKKKNVILLLTSDKALLPALLRKINDAREKYNITLFGLPEWEDLEIDHRYLLNLDTHLYRPWFVDYSREPVKKFVESFNGRYKTDPGLDKGAFLGYDITLFFLNMLYNYGTGFTNCLGYAGGDALSTRFNFRKKAGGGYENTASSVYVLKDYKRVLVNR